MDNKLEYNAHTSPRLPWLKMSSNNSNNSNKPGKKKLAAATGSSPYSSGSECSPRQSPMIPPRRRYSKATLEVSGGVTEPGFVDKPASFYIVNIL